MADDELDDLFGAFDGPEDSQLPDNDYEPLLEKESVSKRNKVMDEEEQQAAEEVVVDKDLINDTNGDSPVTMSNKILNGDASMLSMPIPSSKTFADVMSKPLTKVTDSDATKSNEITSVNGENKDDKEKEDAEKNRVIATGTSHDKSVRSYSAYPKNLPPGVTSENSTTLPTPLTPAKTYPFPLDPFQEQAIRYLDREESVLVAAHTSAGKTAVAEYAIAKSLKAGQRVVYTSPIKALSNQKFRDLQQEFETVGLMTGDITINPQATCLVMTTEILRQMLYRGSELMREVAWVIYDEVHYMRDAERGVVWEESIILLPHRVRFVFLSATIPNATQFADWIAHIHHQPCHVVYTNYRPVPLQHYIFPQGGDGLHLVVDERGRFREANFQAAMATLQSGTVDGTAVNDAILGSGGGGHAKGKKRGRGGTPQQQRRGGQFTDLHRIVKLVMDRNLNPVIIFSFSKKDCERFALALKREDFTDDVEKDLITQVYKNAIDSLSQDDQRLPQVEALLPLLKRGIGIHHGGLLPILKEIVEILFAEGLIKTLFATETFSIGINMPAKTVVFTNTRKWDGKDFRWVTSGEYIQMSGRAGRRGKDDRGIVIQMLDEKIEPAVCKDILYGAPDPLNSSYRISFNMLLNLMRVEDVDPEYLLRASFHQFQREKDAPGLLAQAEELEQEASIIKIGSSPEETELASQYYSMDQQRLVVRQRIAKEVRKPERIMKFLTPGRLVDVVLGDYLTGSYGWGVLVSCKKKPGTGSGGESGRLATMSNEPEFTLEVLLSCVDRHFDTNVRNGKTEDMENASLLWRGSFRECRPVKESDDKRVISMRVFTIDLDGVDQISAVKLFIPQDLMRPEARRKVAMSLTEAKRKLSGEFPLLNPVTDMGITDLAFATLLKRAEALTERMNLHKLVTEFAAKDRLALLRAFETKSELLNKAKALREEARGCQTMAMKDDLKKMKRVLKSLGHVDANGVIQTKGRTACEINTADELVVVELMFTGVFNDLDVEQAVALLSCLIFDERMKDDDDQFKGMKPYLFTPFLKLKEVARTVARVKIACGIEINEDESVDKINPGMMEVVFGWCKGMKFIEVQKLTESFEGTTIRTLRRLEELVRQISVAAKAIGNNELEAKFEKGDELLKRDIVFCSSLYL